MGLGRRTSRRGPPGQLLIKEIPTGGNLREESSTIKAILLTVRRRERLTRPGAPSGQERIPMRNAARTPSFRKMFRRERSLFPVF